MARTDVLKYEYENYYVDALKSGTLTEKEMRSEYSRLRKIANARIEALGRSTFRNSQAYLKNVGKYVTLDKIESERDLIYKLHDLAKFVTAKSGSVTGQYEMRRNSLESLRERDLDFVNERNFELFGQFMEEARIRGYAKIYGSERIAELFGAASKKGINPKELFRDFGFWMENKQKLEEMPKIKNKKKRNSDEYKKAIEREEKKREAKKEKRSQKNKKR